jgi:hypothetical protein
MYQGEWRNGHCHGYGTQIRASGNFYEGEWNAGYRHGHGTFVHTDGRMYRGQWQWGNRHGKGRVDTLAGLSYVGDWVNDKAHGQATISDGRVEYTGEFKMGMRDGQGIITRYPDGNTWVGCWKANRRVQGSYV